ncbi:uncharacterized protein LOC116596172 isoform X5 [Mustela erminea]|uniref:uncharacterized protein LOC116596172 isoform X5 n=1 Tax=Mustela erminea TaxID=36723 RepID=UPI0013871AFE|nr:uncharacterized protein LOC116596172 isoform X5 [Mustela erminea]
MPMKPGREPLSISWFPPRNSCPQIPFLREDTEGQSWTAEGQEAFSAASPGTSPQTMGSEPQDGTCVQSSRRSTDASQQNGQTSLRRAGGRQSVPPMSACQPGHVSLSSSSAHRSSGAGADKSDYITLLLKMLHGPPFQTL